MRFSYRKFSWAAMWRIIDGWDGDGVEMGFQGPTGSPLQSVTQVREDGGLT